MILISISKLKKVLYLSTFPTKCFSKAEVILVTKGAKDVLAKVAAVLKNQPDVEFMVEGNTDNKVYRGRVI